MNLKDKIDAERQDEPLILLYMEGMFWKAYEQSAMRFTKEVKAYKLLKRFVKTVNSNVVSMGFPDGSLEEVLKGRAFTRVNDKLVSFCVDTAAGLHLSSKIHVRKNSSFAESKGTCGSCQTTDTLVDGSETN